MKKWLSPARAAGILYLQFTVLCVAVLWLFLGALLDGSSWQRLRSELPTIPGAVELVTVIVVLAVATFALGAWLTLRAKVNLTILVCGAATAVAAFWWSAQAGCECDRLELAQSPALAGSRPGEA